ncbi:hypothetical protein AAVH_27282, partial [Aphelenchoides avenae]
MRLRLQKVQSPGANGITPAYAVGGRMLVKLSCNPTLEFLRTFRDGPQQKGKQSVDVSSEIWQLLLEYDVPAIIERVYRVRIEATRTASKQVQLTLHGRNAAQVARMLSDPPLKLDVPEKVTAWLLAEGTNGRHALDIHNRSGALVQLSKDRKGVQLVGSSQATLAAKSLIDECDCIEEVHIDNFVGFYLINDKAFHQKRLSVETDALISAAPVVGATKWKAVVVGPTESRKFYTYIHLPPLTDDSDQARMVDLVIVGESKQNVDDVLAVIGRMVVEKVNITKLQAEFWMGHEDEQNRNRLLHKIEDTTDTFIDVDFDASCFHIAGRPKDLKRAMDQIRKNQHIKLRTSEISLAAGNYVARIRPKLENDDDLQIHLRYEGMRPGTCELRRLHRVDSDEDVAKADKKLMQEIDLHEIVLDVHKSWARLLVEQSRQIEASEVVGMGVSNDVVNGRVLVNIAGSATTVERGLKTVIRMLDSHRPHRVGDIRLRRIEGQSMDTAGFEEADPVGEEDLSNCKYPFEWE